jgi:hypothetical protein
MPTEQDPRADTTRIAGSPLGNRGKEPVTRAPLARTLRPARVAPPPTEPGWPQEVVRYGPGVPTSPTDAAVTGAEQAWRTGRLPRQPQRRATLPQWLGSALTVVLLAASGIVLYLRFHHPPFRVTAAVVSQQRQPGCGVDVTGMITTNGAAGTVAFQWLVRPERNAPRRFSQSVIEGQRSVAVKFALEGIGHGGAFRTVTLQVLRPDRVSASANVNLSCR